MDKELRGCPFLFLGLDNISTVGGFTPPTHFSAHYRAVFLPESDMTIYILCLNHKKTLFGALMLNQREYMRFKTFF
jgi:hypothetical protein